MYGEPAPADLTPQEEENQRREEEEARRREEEERKRQEDEERAQKAAREKVLQAEQVRKIREKEEREAKERAEKIRREREREKEDERLRKEEEDEKKAAKQKAREEALIRSMGNKETKKKKGAGKAVAVLLCIVGIAFLIGYLYLTLGHITVEKEPNKTTYYVGESFSISGLRLEATYLIGRTETIYGSFDDGITYYPSSFTYAGDVTVWIYYGGKSTTLTVTVEKSEDVSVLLDQTSITLEVGDSQRLEATTTPSGEKVSYSSSDTDVASVSSMGTVTAKAAGTATITASMTYGGKTYEATCKVTVSEAGSISLDQTNITLDVGDTQKLEATTTPSGEIVSFKSSDTDVASVNSLSGAVTAKAAGTATITASMTYGGKTYEATCKVTVSNTMTTGITASKSSVVMSYADAEITSFTVSPSSVSVGDQITRSFGWSYYCEGAQISFTSSGGTDSSVTVTSSDTSVVKVTDQSQSGNVTTVTLSAVWQELNLTNKNSASSSRTATITAIANDGSGEKCTVEVTVTESFSYVITSSDDSIIYCEYDTSGNISNWVIGKTGTVTLTLTSGNGNKATTKLTVIAD